MFLRKSGLGLHHLFRRFSRSLRKAVISFLSIRTSARMTQTLLSLGGGGFSWNFVFTYIFLRNTIEEISIFITIWQQQ